MILKGLDYHVEVGGVDPQIVAKRVVHHVEEGDHKMEVEQSDIHMVLRGSRGSGTAYGGRSR